MNNAWTNVGIARWDSSTGRSGSRSMLRVLFIIINNMYVEIVGSWANHCEHKIIIPSTTESGRATNKLQLMASNLPVKFQSDLVLTRPKEPSQSGRSQVPYSQESSLLRIKTKRSWKPKQEEVTSSIGVMDLS